MNTQDTIVKKLRKVQEASGFSQEQIAKKLGVSFATVNSWFNSRSLPRAKAQEKIDRLFDFYVSGKSAIIQSELEIKKSNLFLQTKKRKDIVKKILARKDLKEQFVLSLTYNSNKIEGSTMTEADTFAVLFDDATVPQKTLTEQLEAKNHQSALEYVFGLFLQKGKIKITKDLILRLHEILMNGILDNAGMYRNHPVRIVGSYVPTSSPKNIAQKMQEFVKYVNSSQKDTFSHVASAHAQFEQIHPFSDGNGRIGRIIIHIMAMNKNLPPVLVENTRKRIYYKYLQKAQLQGEYEFLEDFICDSLLESYKFLD